MAVRPGDATAAGLERGISMEVCGVACAGDGC